MKARRCESCNRTETALKRVHLTLHIGDDVDLCDECRAALVAEETPETSYPVFEEVLAEDFAAAFAQAAHTEPTRPRVFIHPPTDGEDMGEGGVGRVIRAQRALLPALGVDIVPDPAMADVIACHIIIPPEFLKRWPEKRFVLHCHGMYWAEYEWPAWAHKANEGVMEGVRVADAVTAPSEWVARIIERHSERKPVTIYHGVDLQEWAPYDRPDAPTYILWDKNRVDPVCDPTPMLSLASMLAKVPFVSTFTPSGPVPANVQVLGPRPYADMLDVVKQARIYLATTRETFGIATLQALAAGVPVVGYDWGGQQEMGINERKAGILVKPDDFDALLSAVMTVNREREAYSTNARALALGWSWDRPMQQYADLYRELAERDLLRLDFPKTSVVVTSYNLGKYLPDCLRSVMQQTDPDWECIVVDDCSTDDSLAIAEDFARQDGRIRVVKPQENLYQAGARNFGIERSAGKYILPLDADDMLPPNALEILSHHLDTDRSIHIAYGHVLFVEEDGVTRKDYGGPPGRSGWPVPFRWEVQMNGTHNLLPYSSMFRREVWELTGGYRRRLRNGDDPDFWCRASSYGFRPKKVTDGSVETLIYRVRSGSMSHVEAPVRWASWFGWHGENLWRGPAAAVADVPLLIPSLSQPAFSVIIPVGPGHEELVFDAIDSLEAQSFPFWECIVIWDSDQPIPRLPSWVKGIKTGGLGVAKARNMGVRGATGKYLFFLDADDYLQPDCLKTFFEVAEKNPDHILYSDFWEDPEKAGVFKVYNARNFNCRDLLREGSIAAVTQSIPRRLWIEHGLAYDPTISAWEDWDLQLQSAAAGICSLRIPLPLWSYRKHTGFRREANYANKETGKAEIQAKFGKFWNGQETLMACGCSGNGVAPVVDPRAAPSASGDMSGMTLLAYNGPAEADIAFRGPTGERYSFSAGTLKYVFNADVEHLLALPDFSKADIKPASVADAPELISMHPLSRSV